MRRIIVLAIFLVLFLVTPVLAYQVSSVIVESGSVNSTTVLSENVSSNTVVLKGTEAQPLGSNTEIYKVTIQNLTSPTQVLIGRSDLTKNGFVLQHYNSTTGNMVSIATDNLANVYVSGNTGGKVGYLIETKNG